MFVFQELLINEPTGHFLCLCIDVMEFEGKRIISDAARDQREGDALLEACGISYTFDISEALK